MTNESFLTLLREAEKLSNTDELQHAVEAADIVVGVFPDDRTEHGVGYHIIKGEGLLDLIRATGEIPAASLRAIKCDSVEESEAIRRVFGDAATTH